MVKTYLRDRTILPEDGWQHGGHVQWQDQVEIKPETMGHYLGKFFITSKLVKQGGLGISATHSSCFILLK